ncbi:MAG: hypothetical protein OZ921_12455 [Sorangiineae bacterium]|nr:hypothetical protein [Polyangiaceae bacterium]MEB2323318.1 hypothetical protein [Sorangiineae bacterium]
MAAAPCFIRRVLWLVIATLWAGCSAGSSPPGEGPPDAQASTASPEARLVVAAASRLAIAAPELATRLAPSPGMWRLDGDRGARSVMTGRVGAELPARADRALRVGLGKSERHRLTLTPEGARGAELEELDGRAVYREAYPSSDVIFVADGARVEWLYLLRDASAPSRFAYTLALPPGLRAAEVRASGEVAFEDERGNVQLRVPRPFAVDAHGTRREATLALEAGRLVVELDAAGLTFPVLLDPAVETALWEQRTPSTSPPSRSYHAMAYDGARGKTVLFGGRDKGGDPLADTWTWDGSSWANVTPAASPSLEIGHAMAYDSKRGRVVLFGVSTKTGAAPETWEWDGSSWTQATATPSPGKRTFFAMAYDSARGRTVVFGGFNGLGETWEWDGATWKRVATTGPAQRMYASMAYDSARGKTVLFGGDPGSGRLGDTWEWDGTTWAQRATTGPEARASAAMAYDSARKRTVLFSGVAYVSLNDTWEWDGSSWTQIATTGPPGRPRSAMAYDSTRGRAVLFGGYLAGSAAADTWELHARGGACSCPGSGGCPSSDCDTGYCVDGVCCEGASLATTSPPNCATCARCDSAASPGLCAVVTNAKDPDSCATGKTCGPTAVCSLDDGQACTVGGTPCLSGNCVDGFCCDTACSDACAACDGATRGWAGAVDGACASAPVGYPGEPACGAYSCTGSAPTCPGAGATCTSDLACGPAHYCDKTGHCSPRMGQGAVCDPRAGADCFGDDCRVCASGHCADGYCCDTPCAGSCDVCAQSLGASANGTCTLLAAGKSGAPACAPYVCTGASDACGTSCDASAECAANHWCRASDHTCLPAVTNGAACSSPTECSSGHCVEGLCCDTACDSVCMACTAAAKGQGSDGTCGFVAAGRDPRDECPDEGAAMCKLDGACNGAGGCRKYAAGTPCGAVDCAAGTQTGYACDGSGTCKAASTKTCAPYLCQGTACGTTCSRDQDCDERFRCDAARHECVPRDTTNCDPSDDRTQDNPDGTTTDCSPYRCVGNRCKTDCTSVDDCAAPNVCDATKTCVAPDAIAENDEEGCGCRLAGDRRRGGGAAALSVVAALALGVRRRRAGATRRRAAA